MGGKPSKGTPADKRLGSNKGGTAAKPATKAATAKPVAKTSGAALKFGSPAWRAKYSKH